MTLGQRWGGGAHPRGPEPKNCSRLVTSLSKDGESKWNDGSDAGGGVWRLEAQAARLIKDVESNHYGGGEEVGRPSPL